MRATPSQLRGRSFSFFRNITAMITVSGTLSLSRAATFEIRPPGRVRAWYSNSQEETPAIPVSIMKMTLLVVRVLAWGHFGDEEDVEGADDGSDGGGEGGVDAFGAYFGEDSCQSRHDRAEEREEEPRGDLHLSHYIF